MVATCERAGGRALSRDSLCSSRAAALFLLTLLTQLSLRRSIPSISLFTMLLRRRCPTSPPLFLRFRSLSSSRADPDLLLFPVLIPSVCSWESRTRRGGRIENCRQRPRLQYWCRFRLVSSGLGIFFPPSHACSLIIFLFDFSAQKSPPVDPLVV